MVFIKGIDFLLSSIRELTYQLSQYSRLSFIVIKYTEMRFSVRYGIIYKNLILKTKKIALKWYNIVMVPTILLQSFKIQSL